MSFRNLIFIVATSPFFCFAQSAITDIDASVADIQRQLQSFTKIERLKSIDAERTVYLSGNELKIIAVKVLEAKTEKSVNWYFISNELAYCETNWLDVATQQSIFSERCYFDKGHLISWTNSLENNISPLSDKFREMDLELVRYGRQIAREALK